MKMCIDGLSISHMHGTGYYSYTYGLLSSLFEKYPQPEYDLVWDTDLIIPDWFKYKNISYSKLQINRANNDYKLLEEHLKNSKTDLYYSPNNGLSIPEHKVCKYILTVHDLSPVSCSSLVDNKYYHKFTTRFPEAIKKADSIIAVSEFIKNEIIKFYKIPDKKIEVVYPACSKIFKPLDLMTARTFLRERYHIEGKFILYAGSVHSRKNLDILIKTLKLLLRETNNIKLVIVGNIDAKRKEYYLTLKSLTEKLEIQDHVVFTGTVDFCDMPYFYNCADCTVNLSSYEGFPTTAVEAATCNSPVICLRNSSFEEVILPTVFFIEHPDINLLKTALANILYQKEKRNDFISHSPTPLSRYSHETSANKLVHIIESTVYEL